MRPFLTGSSQLFNQQRSSLFARDLFRVNDRFDLQSRAERFFAEAQAFDKDRIVDFAVAHGARVAEQGIVATGNFHFQVFLYLWL